MKNFIVAFSVFMMWAVLGMWYHSCMIKEVCDNEVLTDQQTTENTDSISDNVDEEEEEPITEEEKRVREIITTDSLNVVDSGFNSIYSYPLAPEIHINSPEVSIPQTTSIFIADVTDHLNENPETHLIIYGAYDENEFTSSETENHGITRAAYIRDLLVEEGINSARIDIESIKTDLRFIQNETFDGGILLQIINYDELDEEDNMDAERFNKTIYTNFDETFRPTAEVREYAERLKDFLNENPARRVTITGHTDNVGDAQDNEWIGMERAEAVRDFLLDQGIMEYKIQTMSKGETEPIVDNTTRENRAKNRRIEIEVN